MITEDYVSFETAKLLKEKGFKHWCYKSYGDAVYYKGEPISFDEECELKSEGLEDEIEYVEGGYLYDFGCDNRKKNEKVWAAPTLQVAVKWLGEVHNLFVFPFPQMNTNKFWVEIFQLSDSQEWVNLYCESIELQDYQTQEEACEAGIKYCLEKLI